MAKESFVALSTFRKYSTPEMKKRATEHCAEMSRRRTVRDFSSEPIDRSVIETCLSIAGRAPSGANQQPWKFVVVTDSSVKRKIREAAEEVELQFYTKEATKKWRDALKSLGTGPRKEFLEEAPCLIVIFAEQYSYTSVGEKVKHYYVKESVGIATGMLITALHKAGLASLTYTPVNMTFLNEVLSRPSSEKPFMILVTGYPSDIALVPDLPKKKLEDFTVFI